MERTSILQILPIDNERIKNNEIQLIRAILPRYNEVIPDQVVIQDSVPAFD